jgi:hypothetical protein
MMRTGTSPPVRQEHRRQHPHAPGAIGGAEARAAGVASDSSMGNRQADREQRVTPPRRSPQPFCGCARMMKRPSPSATPSCPRGVVSSAGCSFSGPSTPAASMGADPRDRGGEEERLGSGERLHDFSPVPPAGTRQKRRMVLKRDRTGRGDMQPQPMSASPTPKVGGGASGWWYEPPSRAAAVRRAG